MATIRLQNDCPNTYVSVPGIFIDKYLADANGEFVKVYLYLLRCMNSYTSECSISAIADHFDHTEKDVLRALKYWEKVGVLRLETDDKNRVCSISFCDIYTGEVCSSIDNKAITTDATTVSAASTSEEVVHPEPSIYTQPKKLSPIAETIKKEYTLDEMKKFSEDPDVAELLFIMESYLKHPLSSSEMNTVFFWIDSLHFSRDLVEHLVEHCITNGHSSLRYMDKVAMGWAENGITTVEQAKEHSAIRSKACYAVMKALGISGRSLIDSEAAYVNKWTKEFGFDLKLIEEACKRTISATHQPSFEYTDSILTNWKNKDVHTLKDVAGLDAEYSKTKKATTTTRAVNSAKNNKFINFNQRAYDFEALEKDLLTTSIQ